VQPMDEDMAHRLADLTFAGFADQRGEFVREGLFAADADLVRKHTAQIISLSDKAIAHADRRGPEFPVSFSEIDEAIDVLEALIIRYNLLLTGGSMPRGTPYDNTNSIGVFTFRVD